MLLLQEALFFFHLHREWNVHILAEGRKIAATSYLPTQPMTDYERALETIEWKIALASDVEKLRPIHGTH